MKKENELPKEWRLTADTKARLTNFAELNKFAEELIDPEEGDDIWRTDPVYRSRALEIYKTSTSIILQQAKSDSERASLISLYQRCFAYNPFFVTASNASTEQEMESYRKDMSLQCSNFLPAGNRPRVNSSSRRPKKSEEAIWLATDENLWRSYAYHLSIRPRLDICYQGKPYTPDLYIWMPVNPCIRVAIEYTLPNSETDKWRLLCAARVTLLHLRRMTPLSETADTLYAALVFMRFSNCHPWADLELIHK